MQCNSDVECISSYKNTGYNVDGLHSTDTRSKSLGELLVQLFGMY